MGEPPSNHELARQLAVLEERMKTMQESYEASLARVEAANERREAANERRAKEQTRWMAGLGIAVISSIIGGFVLLGFMLQS